MTAAEVLATRPRWLRAAPAAFVLWALWAAYSNAGHGTATTVRAALVQGTASFAITIYLTLSVAWLFHRCRIPRLRPVIPVLGTVAVTGSFLMLLHHLVGTPEIFVTVAPPITVAALYCAYVNASLLRTARHSKQHN
jgi:hypothetical protein